MKIDKTKLYQTLTPDQEYQILMNILDDKYPFIDNGSSRAVYEFDNGIILKLALDDGGKTQNDKEIELYWQLGGEYLADIYAYGDSIILMEEVDIYYKNLRDWYIDDLDFWGDDEHEFTEEEIDNIHNTISVIEDYLGGTADNDQIGYSYKKGKFVSYDYGFEVENKQNSIGSMHDYVYDDEYFEEAINIRLDYLLELMEMA